MNEQDLFLRALQHPNPAERLDYLDRACNGQIQLRQRVEVLLLAHSRAADNFLESPAAGSVATIDHSPLAEKPGTIIGPYKLLQQIGEGGMGVVYMADQESPVRRRVALKIIKPGMDSRQVIARFEAERQALAMMDHQNIAKVLDAGTTESSRPYFVMELVHGVPITKFCGDNRLTLRERLELFVPVCHAIQHAHQKGVIHRDIKPTNILVTMYDDKPVPKVIDFGVAKAVEQRLTEKTLFTQYGMLVGTFEYMSPEQAEMNAYGVDTRSDVYSLGVLLYELLTGTTPIEGSKLRDAALVELVRLIKEEEPLRPSIRLSTSGALPKFAAACRTDAAQLPKQVRGELDWIVMKCLEKDRTRRYETVNGLAHDIQRYLHDEPVEACPPSPLYRLKKLAKKHRGLLTTAASFVGLLLLAALLSTLLAAWAFQAQRTAQLALTSERAARQEAEAAKQSAERAAHRLSQATQLTSDGIEYYTRSNWHAAHEHFTRAVQTEPGLNTPYIYRGALYTHLGLWDKAVADYDRRFQLAKSANAETWFDYLLLKVYNGDDAGYREACQEMLRQHKSSAQVRHRYCVVRSCLLTSKPVGDAEEIVRRAEALAASASAPWYIGIAGRAHLLAGNYEQAEARCREAIKLGTGSPHGVHRVNHLNLALALHHQGKAEARKALAVADNAKDQWTTAMQNAFVGTRPLNWCDWLEFLHLHREATMSITGAPPQADPRLAAIYDRALATVTFGDVSTHMDTGRQHVRLQAWDDAAASFVHVLDKLPPDFRGASPEMRFCVEMVHTPVVFDRLVKLRPANHHLWNARACTDASSREWSKAAVEMRKTLELVSSELSSDDPPNRLSNWYAWAGANCGLGALLLLADDELAYQELCNSILETPGIVEDPVVLSCTSRACTMSPDAVTDFTKPVKWAQYAVQQNPRTAWHIYAQGIAQHRAGQHEEAIHSLQRSLAVSKDWVGRGQNYATLALACHSLGRDQEARQWLNQTKSWLNEVNRNAAGWKFGFAASDFLGDWLCAQVLLAEAEKLVASGETP